MSFEFYPVLIALSKRGLFESTLQVSMTFLKLSKSGSLPNDILMSLSSFDQRAVFKYVRSFESDLL